MRNVNVLLAVLLQLWRTEQTLSLDRYELSVTVHDLTTEGKLHDCARCDRHLPQYAACDIDALVSVNTPKGWHASNHFRGPKDQNWYRGNVAAISLRGFNQIPSTVGVSVLLQDRDLFKHRELIASVHRQQPIVGRGRYTSRLYGGCGTAMTLTIDLHCLNGFAGPACDCRNDTRYYCDENGLKHCLDQFYGNNCQYTLTTSRLPTTTTEDLTRISMRSYCNKLRNGGDISPMDECGVANDAAVPAELNTLVNASQEQWPFVVPVVRTGVTGRLSGSLQCTAVLIQRQLLLTLASCFKFARGAPRPQFAARFRLGNSERLVNIVKVLTHAKQNVTKFSDNQLAVLVLQQPVPQSMAPVCLPTLPSVSDTLITHRWTSTYSNGQSRYRLSVAAETLYNASLCVSAHNDKAERGQDRISESAGDVLCTLKPTNEDSGADVNCNQQSGALIGLSGKRWTILGIMHGTDACDLDLPEIYHSVQSYIDWIRSIIMAYACSAH